YPLLREALPGLMETEGEALLSGVFDLERAPRSLSRNLEGLAPPSLPLKVGWDEGLEGLDLLIGSIKKANVTLGWDVAQSAYQLAVDLDGGEHGSLKAMLDGADPADPKQLLDAI